MSSIKQNNNIQYKSFLLLVKSISFPKFGKYIALSCGRHLLVAYASTWAVSRSRIHLWWLWIAYGPTNPGARIAYQKSTNWCRINQLLEVACERPATKRDQTFYKDASNFIENFRTTKLKLRHTKTYRLTPGKIFTSLANGPTHSTTDNACRYFC